MNLNFQTGYIIETKVMYDLISHFGIIVVENNEILIIHNTIKDNVVVEDLVSFLKDRKFVNIYKNNVCFDKIHEYKNHKYNLFTFNCIDFVNLVSI